MKTIEIITNGSVGIAPLGYNPTEKLDVGFGETCPKTKLDTKSNSFFSPKVELKTPFTPKTRVIR